jgi:peptidoglycan hydrolase CwlO-like protein
LVKQRSLRNKAESKQRDYETHIISLKNEEDKLKGNIRDTEKEIDRLQADIKDKSSLIGDLEASGAALGLQL